MISSLQTDQLFISKSDDYQSLRSAVYAAQDYLLSIQAEDGHWRAELETDTILQSEYVFLMHYLGRFDDPRVQKAAEYIRRQQLPDGGWAIYQGGPANVSSSVKSYMVLKWVGDSPEAPHMQKARRVILELGGIDACNTYTKIYLAILGQYPWEKCPAIPPEIILFPDWFYFNIYEMSSWSRAMMMPLSIIWAYRTLAPAPPHANIRELFSPHKGPPPPNLPTTMKGHFWYHFLGFSERIVKMVDRLPFNPLRERAIQEVEAWIIKGLRKSDGLGAIFPGILNTIMSFHQLGYSVDDPLIQSQMAELEKHIIEEEEVLRFEPCLSPVWDTLLTMNGLLASGLSPSHPQLLKAGDWILTKEVTEAGDWQVKNPDGPIGGWYFEYANEFYPDCDDTGEALAVLSQLRYPDKEREAQCQGAIERALGWMLSMQNKDGGWAAFDKGCDKEWLIYIPFADHNAMLDPSDEDITGRALEAFVSGLNLDPHHPSVRGGVQFLHDKQEEDGTWYGRWGANYIYGTWLALSGLRATGEDMSAPRYRKTAQWFYRHQNADGGWGESLRSYDDPAFKGQGDSTAAQTAWSLMGLFALGDYDSEAIQRGIRYLLQQQRPDGSWDDELWTGTGFPRVLYLRYHLYATYFSLQALGMYQKKKGTFIGSMNGKVS